MDADLSHRKKDLIDMMKYIDKYDVIVEADIFLAVEVRVGEFIENYSQNMQIS